MWDKGGQLIHQHGINLKCHQIHGTENSDVEPGSLTKQMLVNRGINEQMNR